MTKCGKENPTGTPNECLRAGIFVGKQLQTKILPTLSKDVLRELAKRSRVRGYSNMSKTQLYSALQQAGVRTFNFSLLGQPSD